MKVILKENIKGVGSKYEVRDVADGYANNFLIPRKLAEYATPLAARKAEILKSTILAEKQIREKLTEKQIEILKSVKIILKKRGNDKGHLFEKIHPAEISQSLKEQAKIEIDPEFLTIGKPIKEIGEHMVGVQIGKNKGEFKVIIEIDK
ncbi:MAG: 50S ribosomal protein L9 [Candidatus Zambryskibacteria bacterium RIFCSPHIGHO2_12_FULL_38_34]|uniref:Large ribosomal subunit protein bL9 n=1 Tax=Candidatus Zambryskibacteria bacterium RIFCSPLOWO2_12_FULL_39_16 TaxID=1802775 RepID=A0A1G2URN8_9BACT|nr:MAG: 50S ribosomal protein L9 [Candidatus Zambryskibacteria bacterium RIFCSPHIGHO2_12_FULL_38_34]OHB09277.1 MAG: 50S ribosomal protein L9 [Candidatus Zambryskibacteria bacterium RIFCSPLOWO2_02_FULL_38_13]OHB12031.1 MAG: 50S ribosomal protein L9 [Candidatus Zambryskibacteria bacterium RIFCSPLOWO2_12_FULL_39_16]